MDSAVATNLSFPDARCQFQEIKSIDEPSQGRSLLRNDWYQVLAIFKKCGFLGFDRGFGILQPLIHVFDLKS